MSIHERRREWYDCQRWGCGHSYEQHPERGGCQAYHCRCRGFVATPERRWWGTR